MFYNYTHERYTSNQKFYYTAVSELNNPSVEIFLFHFNDVEPYFYRLLEHHSVREETLLSPLYQDVE